MLLDTNAATVTTDVSEPMSDSMKRRPNGVSPLGPGWRQAGHRRLGTKMGDARRPALDPSAPIFGSV